VLAVMVEARDGRIFTAPVLSKIWEITEAVDGLPGVNHDQVRPSGTQRLGQRQSSGVR
jgi:hypothetical protein